MEGGVWPRLITRGYREAARWTAALLQPAEIVRSVLVHRSIAAGEVTFPYSDIDLMVIVRQPQAESMDGAELLDLYKRVRWLRWLNPRLGHVEIHDQEGFESWFHTDTFRGSKERRCATLLCGEPVSMPEVPIRREDALRRFALWPYYFLSPAILQRNSRNLRKVALEMWSAYATATGLISEPFLTRRDTEAFCRTASESSIPGDLKQARDALTFLFRTAEQLHEKLLPPLPRLQEPIIERIPILTFGRTLSFVVLPRADSPLPEGKLNPGMSFFTPELLDICVQFAAPNLYWSLTPALLATGIRQPSAAAFLQSAQYYTHSVMLRNPGFTVNSTVFPLELNAITRHITKQLAKGVIPGPPDETDAAVLSPPSIGEYYRNFYPRLMAEYRDTAAMLKPLEKSKIEPSTVT